MGNTDVIGTTLGTADDMGALLLSSCSTPPIINDVVVGTIFALMDIVQSS